MKYTVTPCIRRARYDATNLMSPNNYETIHVSFNGYTHYCTYVHVTVLH